MPSACIPLYSPTPSLLLNSSKPKTFSFQNPSSKKCNNKHMTCKASSSSSSSSITDFDLYDLLGIDSSSDQSQIKTAYRSLQKRCHPDIAGRPGHDMAIILNEAYSVLSDPSSRLAYDKEQAKTEELKGYTGKTLYSVWMGSESEERAVFVDEVKCVGCLKCALLAEKTFAIESVYGRARVVGQWADPEPKIQEAMEACPVDCISIVERSNLAALEFLMSKQPRASVRMSAGNTAGERVSNIFADVKKFQTKLRNSTASKQQQQETDDLQRAIQAIRTISNWLYWQSPKNESCRNLIRVPRNKSFTAGPDINKLREAAAARKQAKQSLPSSKYNIHTDDEYWVPSVLSLPVDTATTTTNENESNATAFELKTTNVEEQEFYRIAGERKNRKSTTPLRWRIPMGTGTIGAMIVGLQVGGGGGGGGGGNVAVGEVKQHIGGSIALEMVNSSCLQIFLAGITWYCVGIGLLQLVEALQTKNRPR